MKLTPLLLVFGASLSILLLVHYLSNDVIVGVSRLSCTVSKDVVPISRTLNTPRCVDIGPMDDACIDDMYQSKNICFLATLELLGGEPKPTVLPQEGPFPGSLPPVYTPEVGSRVELTLTTPLEIHTGITEWAGSKWLYTCSMYVYEPVRETECVYLVTTKGGINTTVDCTGQWLCDARIRRAVTRHSTLLDILL